MGIVDLPQSGTAAPQGLQHFSEGRAIVPFVFANDLCSI